MEFKLFKYVMKIKRMDMTRGHRLNQYSLQKIIAYLKHVQNNKIIKLNFKGLLIYFGSITIFPVS